MDKKTLKEFIEHDGVIWGSSGWKESLSENDTCIAGQVYTRQHYELNNKVKGEGDMVNALLKFH